MSDHDGVEQVITMAWRTHNDDDALRHSRDVIKNLNPTWYVWENNVLRRFDLDYPRWSYPGAGLTTTISDLAKWDAALYTETLVKRSTLERLWARTRLNS